jgi:GNAT superfamily N-acetyltransferase
MSDAPFTVTAAGREHAHAIVELFEREGSACFCRWWHFSGDKNAWLARLAHAPADNRRELLAAFEAGSDEARGLVALASERVIGWMKLAPASAMHKLYEQKPYRGLPVFGGDRSGVWVIGCFLVDPEWRRRGVSRALVGASIAIAQGAGASAIEAFPRSAEPVSEELLWTGPPSVLREAGFEVVDSSGPYPVLRRPLP